MTYRRQTGDCSNGKCQSVSVCGSTLMDGHLVPQPGNGKARVAGTLANACGYESIYF